MIRGRPPTKDTGLPRRVSKIGRKYYYRYSQNYVIEQVSLGRDKDHAIDTANKLNAIIDAPSPYRKPRGNLRLAIFERDGHKCVYCGATERLTIDHKVPISRGGQTKTANLLTACHSCNSSKGNQRHEDFRAQK